MKIFRSLAFLLSYCLSSNHLFLAMNFCMSEKSLVFVKGFRLVLNRYLKVWTLGQKDYELLVFLMKISDFYFLLYSHLVLTESFSTQAPSVYFPSSLKAHTRYYEMSVCWVLLGFAFLN